MTPDAKSKDVLIAKFSERADHFGESTKVLSLGNASKIMEMYAEQKTIAFVEWLTNLGSPYAPQYGQPQRWCDSEREYTTAHLYQLFKQQKA